ncbi:uncharacterized protein LOC110732593 [Chenopodium quinoa]|uniref:uncharacterized protein LOC110732593 n=1 Tax=Chenopodium quinoa TaxID=63459 RepID=UPI000B779DA0|nr:uncharacterized protein LOC110732593 [Chenopodium quinoa]
MANKLGESSFRSKKNLDNWKFPSIPVGEVYKKNLFRIFPSYAVKDFEETITLDGDNNRNVSFELLSCNFQKGFIKEHHRFLHLGLVQIAVKPLIRDGLGTPVAVCLRDTRHLDFQNSLLALVESDLSQGPFYFNCFPSFSFSLADVSSFEIMILNSRTPLALIYRVVCKAMLDLRPEALKEPILGESAYFQPATGANGTTKWEEYVTKVHESSSTGKQESEAQDGIALEILPDGPDLQQGRSMAIKLVNEEGDNSPIKMNLDDWKYPKIPIIEVYNRTHDKIVSVYGYGPSFWSKAKKKLSVFPSSVVKDFEKTITESK